MAISSHVCFFPAFLEILAFSCPRNGRRLPARVINELADDVDRFHFDVSARFFLQFHRITSRTNLAGPTGLQGSTQ
jgi:hypothetical protein